MADRSCLDRARTAPCDTPTTEPCGRGAAIELLAPGVPLRIDAIIAQAWRGARRSRADRLGRAHSVALQRVDDASRWAAERLLEGRPPHRG
jgi:hypothetical protein